MSIDINVGYLSDESTEKKSVTDFVWYGEEVRVKEVVSNFPDEWDGYANIIMTNGDNIIYRLSETRHPQSGQFCPPFTKFDFSINGKTITTNLDDVLKGNGIFNDILNVYVKWKNKK